MLDSVSSTKEPLKEETGNQFPHLFPKAYMREAQSDVECGAAPVFRPEEAMKLMSHKRRDLQQRNGTNADG